MTQNCNCDCGNFTMLPVRGFGLAVDTSGLPGGDGIVPGPDNTHLVTRNGKLVWEPIGQGMLPGEGLLLDLDLYVAITGDDANDGLTPGTAMATVHRAVKYLENIRFSWNTATIHVADGVYNGTTLVLNNQTYSRLKIIGESRENTVLSFCIHVSFSLIILENLSINVASNNGNTITGGNEAHITMKDVNVHDDNGWTLIMCNFTARMVLEGNVSLSGTVGIFLHAIGGLIVVQTTAVLSINGTASSSTVLSSGGWIGCRIKPSGSVTGKRFASRRLGFIDTNGGGTAHFPGTVNGTAETSTGGYYI